MIQGLAERLKKLREKYHYSQKDVAKQLNISPSIVSGYETGERTPSAEKLLSLSSLYHCYRLLAWKNIWEPWDDYPCWSFKSWPD